jgi:predicted MPP superfamily phosphohydrolase
MTETDRIAVKLDLKRLRNEDNLKWKEIYELYPDVNPNTLRRMYGDYMRELRRHSTERPNIDGVTAEEAPDPEDVFRKALAINEKQKQLEERRDNQLISFDDEPVMIVNMSDLHLGGAETDYARIEDEVNLILDCPNAYIGLHGDLVNNFIIGYLSRIALGTEIKICEEWILAERFLKKVSPRLIWHVGGNHDKWTYLLTNVDKLEEIQKLTNSTVLYDKDEINTDVAVGDFVTSWRIRHKWRFNSFMNPTHGLEAASRRDKGKSADFHVGGHTHVSGLCRPYNNGGKTGFAIITGSYKIGDSYTRTQGFASPNEHTAVAVILTPEGDVIPPPSLETGVKLMNLLV